MKEKMMLVKDECLVLTAEDCFVLSEATKGVEGWMRLDPEQRRRFTDIITTLRDASSQVNTDPIA